MRNGRPTHSLGIRTENTMTYGSFARILRKLRPQRRLAAAGRVLADAGIAAAARAGLPAARRKLAAEAYKAHGARTTRIFAHFSTLLEAHGPHTGDLLEIGGQYNPIRNRFDPSRYRYTAIDLARTADFVIEADITNCPHIPDQSFDVIYSVDVFEHINRPWRAAEEITRLLRPGGLVYTSTLFSWRYHPCPIDYWRFTPECLAFLFSGLETVASGFDTLERRRNIVGDGDNKVVEDAFGGWREHWRVYHVGRKPR